MKNDVKAALPELGYAQLVCSIEMIKRMTHFGITLFFRSNTSKQSGAAEACWAHNPEVRRSKLRSANIFNSSLTKAILIERGDLSYIPKENIVYIFLYQLHFVSTFLQS